MDEEPDGAQAWEGRLARYSAALAAAPAPQIPERGHAAMFAAVRRLIPACRLGRSRRWRPLPRGPRFDLRGTLRASLHTGGDPVWVRRLGHPHRNPRFDGLDRREPLDDRLRRAGPAIRLRAVPTQSAGRAPTSSVPSYAASRATCSVPPLRPGGAWHGLGEAWGGGTRIGAKPRALRGCARGDVGGQRHGDDRRFGRLRHRRHPPNSFARCEASAAAVRSSSGSILTPASPATGRPPAGCWRRSPISTGWLPRRMHAPSAT